MELCRLINILLTTHCNKLIAFLLFIFSGNYTIGQGNKYIYKGEASISTCHCYSITPPTLYIAGAVWNENQIDLTKAFDFTFKLYFDCNDDLGGDGIAFVLQPGTEVGYRGEGLGFQNLSPSIGITMDTWDNPSLNDAIVDHISIQLNGVVKHGNDLAGPIPISAKSNNVEDCQWHKFRVTWDPLTKWFRTYFDGDLRVASQIDMVQSVFSGDPIVYWGFTGGTGGAVNLQQFCTILDAAFSFKGQTCAGKNIEFTNHSESFFPVLQYYWDFGDGSSSTEINPVHIYTTPGEYTIRLSVTDIYNCVSDTTKKKIIIGDKPSADFTISDACFNSIPAFSLQSNNVYSSDKWFINNKLFSTDSIPDLTKLPSGELVMKHIAISDHGCGNDTLLRNFSIQKPYASAGNDSLVLENVPFQLNGTGNGQLSWQPSLGLNNSFSARPTCILNKDQSYELTVVTSVGCIAKDTVKFLVFSGANVYIPTAFTPNSDGRNDLFRPRYVGISKLNSFSVFNRWGELVFATSNMSLGWDGRIKNKEAPTGTYIWLLDAENIHGKKVQMKGAVTILR